MPDPLSAQYRDLLEGTYDGVNRIVLNACFRMSHSGGGFRTWWQKLVGSEESSRMSADFRSETPPRQSEASIAEKRFFFGQTKPIQVS
jgi:hypothetical protein